MTRVRPPRSLTDLRSKPLTRSLLSSMTQLPDYKFPWSIRQTRIMQRPMHSLTMPVMVVRISSPSPPLSFSKIGSPLASVLFRGSEVELAWQRAKDCSPGWPEKCSCQSATASKLFFSFFYSFGGERKKKKLHHKLMLSFRIPTCIHE